MEGGSAEHGKGRGFVGMAGAGRRAAFPEVVEPTGVP